MQQLLQEGDYTPEKKKHSPVYSAVSAIYWLAATALYLARLLKPMGVTVTRIAHGVPVGGDLEYADEVTLGRALTGRRNM